MLLGYWDWMSQEQKLLVMLKKLFWLAFKYLTQEVNQKIILNLKVSHVIIKMTHFKLTLLTNVSLKRHWCLIKFARCDTSAEIVSARNIFQRFFLSNHWHSPCPLPFPIVFAKPAVGFMLVIFVLLVKVSFLKQLLKPQYMYNWV